MRGSCTAMPSGSATSTIARAMSMSAREGVTSVSATGAERYQPDDAEGVRVAPPAEYDKPFVGKLEEFIAKDLEELESFCWGLSALGCARHWPASESGPPLRDRRRPAASAEA